MSADVLNQLTRALQLLLHDAVKRSPPPVDPSQTVAIGTPEDDDKLPVRLLLFHVEPNREQRNDKRLAVAPDNAAQNSIPLDVRYLIVVNRLSAGPDVQDTNELSNLGRIIAKLQAEPTITGSLLPGQNVRLTPEPYPLEELSRIWSLFPKAAYRPSVVYLASPVFVDAEPLVRGRPVVSRRIDGGLSADAPDVDGRRREEAQRRAILEGRQ